MGVFSGIKKSVGGLTSGFFGLDQAFDFVDGTVLGGDARDASLAAAQLQARSADKAIDLQEETRDLARKDLAPFRAFGEGQIDPLNALLTPEGQAAYLQDNPLFQNSLDQVNRTTLAGNAAAGKLNSGGTLQALQNNYLATALPFLNNQQNNLFNAVGLGQSSAAGQANNALNSANNISNLYGQQANALAAGEVGAANARQAGFNNLLGVGGLGLRALGA